jgi:hypothetical protein
MGKWGWQCGEERVCGSEPVHDNGGSTHLWIIDLLQWDYTALHPRMISSSLVIRASAQTPCMSIFVCSHVIVVVHIDRGRLCLWTVATNRPLFIPQVTYEYGEQWWNYTDRGKLKTSEKNLSQCHLSTTNPTWSDLGANPSLHKENPATNHLSHGMAPPVIWVCPWKSWLHWNLD